MTASQDQLLTVSAAGKLLGLDRRSMQGLIRDGHLPTFEGLVRMNDLAVCFPNFDTADRSGLERLERFKESANSRRYSQHRVAPKEAVLQRQVEILKKENERLVAELDQSRAKSERRQELIQTLRYKLEDLKAGCEKQEAAMLGAVISWLVRQAAERR